MTKTRITNLEEARRAREQSWQYIEKFYAEFEAAWASIDMNNPHNLSDELIKTAVIGVMTELAFRKGSRISK